MELLTALYTADIGFQPELIGWWMLWTLRIGLIAMPALCLTAKLATLFADRACRKVSK